MDISPLHLSIQQKLKQASDSHFYLQKGHEVILNKWSTLLSDEEVLYIDANDDTFSLILKMAIQYRVEMIAVEEMFT